MLELSEVPSSLPEQNDLEGAAVSGQMEEVLRHRYIYVPRGTETDTIQPGKRLGLAIARERRAHLTVVAPRKDSATHHPELAKLDIVTERSGHPRDGGVVLAWCPPTRLWRRSSSLSSPC